MSIARRSFASLLVALCCASVVRAEVSAETDVFGTYLRTVVSSNTSVKALRIWSVGRVRPTHWPLNPMGDVNGDLMPFIAENSAQGRWPWVAWSRFNGTDFDLVWSRWTGRGWTAVAPVEPVPTADDELDGTITFDREGRALIAWVSKGPAGTSSVSVSMFLATRWMAPFRVSQPAEVASDPTIVVRADGTIEITYVTPEGQVTRSLTITKPWTITDDITPFGTMTVSDPRTGSGGPLGR